MTGRGPSALFDALATIEAPRRGAGGYPVHKRLLPLDHGHPDVYDWLARRLGVGPTDHVLDAGCGVGFGTLRMIEHGAARATGITVSPKELELARRAAVQIPARAVAFELGSFADAPPGAFDVVLAVESLSHSVDLASSLGALRGALAPGGRLAVVSDFFVGDPAERGARMLVDDWQLAHLWRPEDYLQVLGAERCEFVDLTWAVRQGSAAARAFQVAGLSLAITSTTGARRLALRAFRGGVRLEGLYARGAMRYGAILYRSHPSTGA